MRLRKLPKPNEYYAPHNTLTRLVADLVLAIIKTPSETHASYSLSDNSTMVWQN